MRKLTIFLLLLLALPVAAQAQDFYGVISAYSTDCSTTASCVVIQLPPHISTVGIGIVGTFSATLRFEGSVDGTNWGSVLAQAPYNSSYMGQITPNLSYATAAGEWIMPVAGYDKLRIRCSSYASGSATVYVNFSNGTYAVLNDSMNFGVNTISLIPSYSAGFALTYVAGDAIEIVGANGKTISILAIKMEGPSAASNWTLRKQSAVDTGGTSTNATDVSHSSNDASGNVTIKLYTAAPSAGTSVGTLMAGYAPSSSYIAVLSPVGNQKGWVLRSSSESLVLNMAVGGTCSFTVMWIEQ